MVGFTTLSFHIGPIQAVHFLDEILSAFDELTNNYSLENIKTIGDAYMVAGALPLPRPDHARAIAELALDMQAKIGSLHHEYSISIHLRIGICTGPVVAGVIGRKKFAMISGGMRSTWPAGWNPSLMPAALSWRPPPNCEVNITPLASEGSAMEMQVLILAQFDPILIRFRSPWCEIAVKQK